MKVDFCEDNLILKVYPTIGGCFQEGWNVLKNHFLILFLAVILAALLDIPMGYKQYLENVGDSYSVGVSFFSLLGFIYYVMIVTPFNYGFDWIYLNAARKKEPQFEEILSGFKKYIVVILSHLLVIGIVGFGFVLLIIPGIYLLCKLVFVPYLVMDKKVDPIQAIKLSFYLSKGYFWTIFGMGILSFFIIILGIICFFVGVFVSIVWIHSAFAVLYNAVEELHFEDACKLADVQIKEE
ncbi:hypothetical protein [Marinifilum caeruleilacunae]|uniref:DUF975 family protein n=1 Tax=Marinifilum caeruleilacunae TaxID=2499076 RepID=A0ABX1WR75_9BACT|nr:hypothetical protein [Marinifilum caeruleilacunae]NOU58587.1 hypothetical protein [Marinifilum caeruleilacunae]